MKQRRIRFRYTFQTPEYKVNRILVGTIIKSYGYRFNSRDTFYQYDFNKNPGALWELVDVWVPKLKTVIRLRVEAKSRTRIRLAMYSDWYGGSKLRAIYNVGIWLTAKDISKFTLGHPSIDESLKEAVKKHPISESAPWVKGVLESGAGCVRMEDFCSSCHKHGVKEQGIVCTDCPHISIIGADLSSEV